MATETGESLSAGKRARGILCYLALARDRKASRERLCSLFWWDRGTAQARASLRQTLLELRMALPPDGPDPLIADRQHVALDQRYVQTDIEAAEAAVSAEALLAILRTMGAEVALDTATFGDGFDDWRAATRPVLEARLRAALVLKLDAAAAGQDHGTVIALADAWAVRDPIDELVAARAIEAEILSNNRSAAERRYRQLSSLMERELGVMPDPNLLDLMNAQSGDRAFGGTAQNGGRAEKTSAPFSIKETPAASDPPSPVGTVLQPFQPMASSIVRWRSAAVLLGLALLAAGVSLVLGPVSPVAEPEVPVIAVLPFNAENGRIEDAVFAEGLATEVMNGLAENMRIRVLGRATALQLTAKSSLRKEARERLGVTRLLTGTLRHQPDRSRLEVEVQLVDSRTGEAEWTRTVRLAETDIASAEHALVELVTRRLLGEAGEPRSSASRPQRLDPGAYRRIVLARQHIQSREGDRLIEARELARQAVEIEPRWAEAHAVRSIAASLMQNYTDMPVEPLLAEAGAAAAQALALDPELPAAHEARSFALEDVDPSQAMAAASRAVLLRPGNVEARRRLAWLLRADGQHRQAAEELEAAIRIDPLWYIPYIDLGISLAQTNEPGKLIALQARHAALDPPPGERDLVRANMLLDTGRAGEAAPIAGRLVRTEPELTYAALTWVDSLLALFAADTIPADLFELNSLPAMVALARNDVVGAARIAEREGPSVWNDPEAALILGHALMSEGQPGKLRAQHRMRYPSLEAYARQSSQTLALGRHPGLYPALAYAAAGDSAGALLIRRKVASDVTRLERLGLAMSQSGVALAALALMDGDRSASLDRLESAMSAQWTVVCHGPVWLGSDPLFKSLSGEPRFAAVLARCRGHLDRQRAAAGLGALPRSGPAGR